MTATTKAFAGGAAAIAAVFMLAAPALADGMGRGSMKDSPKPEAERCKLSANIGLTTDYVFRGFSQTSQGPAVQGGFDATCGLFYAGVWASNLDWGTSAGNTVANIEMDWYAGFKPVTGKITWDLGVIYYTYPNAYDPGGEANYVELKVGASGEVWKDGTVGVTVFFSPDYQYETGNVWTVEGSFSQALPKFNLFRREWTPSFSALLGYQTATGSSTDKTRYISNVTGDDDSYLYWNAGLTFGFAEKWSVDFRYWDTNVDKSATGGSCKASLFACDERFVATLKFTY